MTTPTSTQKVASAVITMLLVLCSSAATADGVLVIKNATVWTQGPESKIETADVLVAGGKIVRVGQSLDAPADAMVIDGTGKHVTPGLIDVHSHLALRGGVNEGTHNITAETRIEDVLDPSSVNIHWQLAGGLTGAHLLHGSSNSIGGQDAVIKLKRDATREEILITGRQGIKFALGENPKRSRSAGRSSSPRYPQTRMGVMESIRKTFIEAQNYEREWQNYEAFTPAEQSRHEPPRRDLQLEAVLEVLNGERTIHCHTYRQDETLAMMRLAEDFGIRIRTFEHALEGYKVADELAAHGVGVTTQSDWWGYKMEAFDATPYNGALLTERGVNVTFSSDSPELARRLNLEAAKAMKYGGMGEEEALACVTSNAARQLDLSHRVGSLEAGKDADFVIWSGHPLSTYSIVEQTWVDGELEFDRLEDIEARETIEQKRNELIAQIRGAAAPEKTEEQKEPSSKKRPAENELVYFDRLSELGGTVSIVGATVHTMVGEPIANATVSFANGRIVEVGQGLEALPGASVIDGKGKHVYPGLIDANSVVGLSEISSVPASVDISETGEINPSLSTAIAINPDSELIPVSRANGITHVLAAPGGALVNGTSTLIRLDGWTWEDLLAAAPAAMHVTWPRFKAVRSWFGPSRQSDEDLEKEREEKLKTIRQLLVDGRAYAIAKNAVSPSSTIEVDPDLEAMLPVIDGTMPVIVYAEELRQIKSAVEWAEEEGIRLVLAGRQDMWRAAEMLAEKGIPVILTNVLAMPAREDEPYDTAYATAAMLHEAGVKFCIAGAANSFSAANTRNLPYHAAMAAAFGLPAEEAIKAITLYPAQILGVGGDLGSIEAGKSASLIMTDGDPLEIRTTVERVFIDGRNADLSTRHTRLYERYKNRPSIN